MTHRRLQLLALVSAFLSASALLLGSSPTATLSLQAAPAAPLTLQEAVERALAKNYTLKVDAFDPQIARARLTSAWGRFDPYLEVSYNYSEDASNVASDPFNPTRPASSLAVQDRYEAGVGGSLPTGTRYSVGVWGLNSRGTFNAFTDQFYTFGGVQVEQPLLRGFGFGANLASIRIARANRSISDWDYRQSIIDTVTTVIVAYQDLHTAVLSLRTAQRSRDLAQGLVTENQRRFQVGSMSEYDVTAARAQAARREEFILIAERAVADQRTFLRSLISDERSFAALQEQLEVVEPPEIARPAGTSVADDFRQALDLRPDYQQARLAIQRGRYNRSFEMNQLLPEVNLVGSYGYHGFGSTWKESRERLQDRDRRSYTAGAVVRIPLTFSEGRGRHRAAKLEVLQAEAQIQQLEQAIMVRVSNAAGQIETARKRVAATRSARELAQQTLDAEIKLLRTATGATSTFVVLQYQEQLAAAEVAEFEARAAEQKAVAEYDRQIGTTLRTWRIQLDPPPAG